MRNIKPSKIDPWAPLIGAAVGVLAVVAGASILWSSSVGVLVCLLILGAGRASIWLQDRKVERPGGSGSRHEA